MNNRITNTQVQVRVLTETCCMCQGRELVYVHLTTDRKFQFLPDIIGIALCTRCGSVWESHFDEHWHKVTVGELLLVQKAPLPDYASRLLNH